MPLLKNKVVKLRNYLNSLLGIDVDYIILRNKETLKYMVSELYSPPPEEVAVQRLAIDLHTNAVELYVSPLEFHRVQEVYGSEGAVEVYAILSSCADAPQDMKCIERTSVDEVLRSKLAKYQRIAVDDVTLCEDMVCFDIRKAVKYIRRSKNVEEIELIKKAVEVAERAVEAVAIQVKQDITELAIASILERVARELGAEGFAFNTIVAVGENTAKPHHIPTTKRFKGREPILIDFGVRISGYVSDITRIIVPANVDNNYIELIHLIENAKAEAISAIRDGVRCNEVDEKARAVLRSNNIHRYFIHGVGHGIGVDVHEDPRLSPNSKDVLVEGDVITVEPGIYVYGKYGVRIEDVVHVGKEKAHILSTGPKVIRI